MFNFLKKKKEENNIDNTEEGLLEIIDNLKKEFTPLNPFLRYQKGKYEYPSMDKITFYLDCNADVIKSKSNLSSLVVTYEWKEINRCKVDVSLTEYNEVYKLCTRNKTLGSLLEDIRVTYSKLNNEKQILFNDACLHTFNTIKESISKTIPDDEMKDVYIELLVLCLEELNEINKETRNNALANLKMEIEYLNKIKETRKTFDLVNNKMNIT